MFVGCFVILYMFFCFKF